MGAAFAELAASIIKRKPPLSRSAVAFFSEDRAFSWEKAHNELGYSPTYDLVTGVAKTVEWYRQREWL